MDRTQAFVGLDVHKDTIAVAIADSQPGGEVRFWGTIENSPARLRSLVEKLAGRYQWIEFTYEAGPCGYEIYRGLTESGLACRVVAPSLIPRRPGDRVKNDRRDAMALARLARAGELTSVWVPDPVHEAMRDLVRARHAANRDVKLARQRVQSFLLRHGLSYAKKAWTGRHRTWLADRSFPHAAQQVAFQGYLNGLDQACARREQLEGQIRDLVPGWSLAGFVGALQSLRGVGLVVAVTVAAEVGEMTRFENPKQLMSFLGLAPGEHSSGQKTRPRGITKTGNATVRCLLYEAAWNYRHAPKVGSYMLAHTPEGLPQEVKDIAWKAQLRLSKRYRQLLAKGKKAQVAITAVARELVGFMWSIDRALHGLASGPIGDAARAGGA
jgi:transposase